MWGISTEVATSAPSYKLLPAILPWRPIFSWADSPKQSMRFFFVQGWHATCKDSTAIRECAPSRSCLPMETYYFASRETVALLSPIWNPREGSITFSLASLLQADNSPPCPRQERFCFYCETPCQHSEEATTTTYLDRELRGQMRLVMRKPNLEAF